MSTSYRSNSGFWINIPDNEYYAFLRSKNDIPQIENAKSNVGGISSIVTINNTMELLVYIDNFSILNSHPDVEYVKLPGKTESMYIPLDMHYIDRIQKYVESNTNVKITITSTYIKFE